MKYLYFLVVALVLSFAIYQHPASAITPPDSCFAFNAGTGTITDYYDNEANNPANPACPRDVDIPSTIGGVSVTTIGEALNYYSTLTATSFANKNLTSVTMPNSVTTIGDYAFYNNQLVATGFGDGITSIGIRAFSNNNITSVVVPSGVTTLNEGLFANNDLVQVTIHSNVIAIGNSALANNELTIVTIPSSVASIGNWAIQNNELASLTIPSTVNSVGNYAFSNNELVSVDVEGSPATLGNGILDDNPVVSISYNGTTYTELDANHESCFAFSSGTVTNFYRADLNYIKSSGQACLARDVNIPSSIGGIPVTTIGNQAFYDNYLKSVVIPDTVTAISSNAFAYNYTLENVEFGNSVTSIASSAFYFSGLTSVTFPSSLSTIGGWAFYGNHLTSVNIPDSVVSIGSEAFSLNHIETAVFGNGVTSLNPWTFSMQADLTEWSGDWHAFENYYYGNNPTEVRAALDAIFYTRVYTADPYNPNDLKNGVIVVDWVELDGDGNSDDIANIGGHIINPASLELKYSSKTNQSLQATQTFTGFMGGDYLRNYFVAQGPEIPEVDNRANPTPAEQQAIDEALAVYYRIGDTVTITPPAIPGYITPPTHTFVLGAATNEEAYVYASATDGSDTDGSGDDGELANTGLSIWLLAGVSLGVVTSSLTVLYRLKSSKSKPYLRA